ncbi:MAG: Nudix family hydrolase [Gammaproteobacteria bacterium]|nr:Nudix family hydrolase [Gammaproteobacteria bacterium]
MSATDNPPCLHVVAAVIRGTDGRILITRRAPQVNHGGLWEFPGGKLSPGEKRLSGLQRELNEELGIGVERAAPLLKITHAYPQQRVLLDVFEVTRWTGTPWGREGQPLQWVLPEGLLDYAFPAANVPIVAAARLPRWCLVTPSPGPSRGAWLRALERCLRAGIRLVQLRAPALAQADYLSLAEASIALVHRYSGQILLNAEPALACALAADGVHLNSLALRAHSTRPLPRPLWVSTACHNRTELAAARALDADFVFISPVAPTGSHPEAPTLGWPGLAALAQTAGLPAFALGGLGPADLARAAHAGCLGVASISACWRDPAGMDEAGAAQALAQLSALEGAAL